MKALSAVLGLYVIYAVLGIRFHTAFIYPFADQPFEMAGFEAVTAGGAHLQVSAPGQGTVLYFMGNAGALAYFEGPLAGHLAAGRGVVALEFPGGGGLPGAPSEAALKAQALAAYDWARAERPGPIVVHGFSMGTGLALHVAAEREVAAVVLDAPYLSMCRLMARQSALPACWLPGIQDWDNVALAGQVTAPVLIQHGRRDGIVPQEDGLHLSALLEEAGVPVVFAGHDGAGHNDLTRAPGYPAALEAFLDDLD